MKDTSPTLNYVHDPMCSWCWGFRPTLEALRLRLPDSVGFNRLLGGLAPDSDAPMPGETREYLQQTWHRIQSRIPGTEFNFAFWSSCEPRRSTWPACRAVIAARAQKPEAESAMILAIQEAYYLQARNPSDGDTLRALAEELGLDGARFGRALNGTDVREQLDIEMAEARHLGATSFPSLCLLIGERARPVQVDYKDTGTMLAQIQALLAD